MRNRRFIGIDINPVSIELALHLLQLPPSKELKDVFLKMREYVGQEIENSYKMRDGPSATHFLWRKDELESVWRVGRNQKRLEFQPTLFDFEQFNMYKEYRSRHIRDLHFFNNSRINSSSSLSLNDLFTGRALRNIDLILEYISQQPRTIKRSLLLILTSAVGQMSRMVFAITGRGKINGNQSKKTEVGSWAIGYWRPALHFEINVWRCFERRAKKLLKAIYEFEISENYSLSQDPFDVLTKNAEVCLLNDDARSVLQKLPEKSISLILTDPPHSDRIPYLELSEIWNAILGYAPCFEKEIVVSNALERGKNKNGYNLEMKEFFVHAIRVLHEDGVIALLFNARDKESWKYLKHAKASTNSIHYWGCLQMYYSAGSLVQDNRKGALKSDYILFFAKNNSSHKKSIRIIDKLTKTPGWSFSFPTIIGE